MSSKRGVRGGKSKSIFGGVVVLGKIKHPRQETLDLLGIVGVKPHINDIMPIICDRLDAEEEARWERLRRSSVRHHHGGSWSDEMIYDCMGEDDFLTEEDLLSLYGHMNSKQLKKLNKKLYGSKGKSSRRSKDLTAKYLGYDVAEDDYWKHRKTMFTHGEWNDDDDDDYSSEYKSIKFYSDVEDEFTCQEFTSLKEFNDFCDEKGYQIGDTDLSNLKNWTVIHCCLDPIDLEYDQYSIITDSSYGGLYWTVSDDLTKKNESEPDDEKEKQVVSSGGARKKDEPFNARLY